MSFGRKEGKEGKEKKGRKGEKKESGMGGGSPALVDGALSHFWKGAAGSPDAGWGLCRLGKCVPQGEGGYANAIKGEVYPFHGP